MHTGKSQMSFRVAIVAAAALFTTLFCGGRSIAGPPRLPTTMMLERVLPGKHYSDNDRILSLQIEQRTVYFVLSDIYTADPEDLFLGDDVWRYVKDSRPNMIVRSRAGGLIAATKPGEMITVQGLFSFASRTFEVSSVSPGRGIDEPIRHY
jgi:hypothetical protein